MKKIKYPLLVSFMLIFCCLHAKEDGLFKQTLLLDNTVNSQLSYGHDTALIGIALDYIHAHIIEWGMRERDIEEMTINDMYTDKSSGITRIYFLQRYQGIPVYQAILNINIDKSGKVFFAGNRFVPGLADKINITTPILSAAEAVTRLATHLKLSSPVLKVKGHVRESQYVFDKNTIASRDITATLIYQPYQDKVLLSWDINLSPVNNNDKWNTRVDAVTGTVLHESNWTYYCLTNNIEINNVGKASQEPSEFINSSLSPVTEGPRYNVWPAPIESPNQGPRTLVAAPIDPVASPFGWHDTDGHQGAEYSITRGNNTHAFQDQDDTDQSSNDEPDGGSDLTFDFPFDASKEPQENVDASVVNLFYWVNYLHDYSYHFGFDEDAGNFQQNNYGKGGAGSDPLLAMALDGLDVGKINNAFYSHDLDGNSGAIEFFVFPGRKSFLTVNEPASVAGKYVTSFPSNDWGAGAYVTDVPVSGEVVVVDDGIEAPYTSDACEAIINASALAGKIAWIHRGGCEFGWKALQAQNAGAIAVICCNIDDDEHTMYAGEYGSEVHIPILMIGRTDCQTLSQFIGHGLKVTLVDPGQHSPMVFDGGLDNELIAHEFGHGITNRIVGGPASVCLDNAESMSEGWSDFFALSIFVLPGDTGEKKRGFATYAANDVAFGKGLRRYPYSTDMNIMPLTYGDVAPNHDFHSLGEVWCAMLWDMYWAFVDKYGWSANPYDESSGNYKAIRLVFEGLKNTPCSPGFVDGRNAILAADETLFNGEDICMLWQVFARRGLGYSADQGSPLDAGDQKEAFDLPPVCTEKLIIKKTVTDFIQPGEEIQVTIKVGNYNVEKASNVIVTDEIPEGTSFKINSSNMPPDLQGNKVLFHLGDLNFKEEAIITYTLTSNPNSWSRRKFLDDVADGNNSNWLTHSMDVETSNEWTITDIYPGHSGLYSWMSNEILENSRQALELNPDVYVFHVEGENPTLRFYHRYDTKAGTNGAIVEVKESGTNDWQQVSEDMLRHGYTGKIDFLTFLTPNLHAFYGNSGDEFQATYVDLSRWSGKDILVRFRFGTVVDISSGLGWLIDDIEFMNLISYNSEVCVISDLRDLECATAPEAGTIVDSREDPVSSTKELETLSARIYPNPASDNITIAWSGDHSSNGIVSLKTIDGKTVLVNPFINSDHGSVEFHTESIPSGLYLVNIQTEKGQFIDKVVIQK